MSSTNSWIKHLWDDLLDLVFPPRCTGCNRVDARWCHQCQAELEAVPLNIQKRKLGASLTVLATGLHEGKLQEAVQALKYNQVPALYLPLSQRLCLTLQASTRTHFDAVIPVPLHPARRQQRGFNQSDLLAWHISHKLNLTYMPDAITRIKDTPPQVGLNRQERLTNVRGAFVADATQLDGQNVLIVDDVCTTGATIATCAQATLKAGASKVYALTVTMATI